MAIKISGITVIDDNRNLASVSTYGITTTATSKTLANREFCTVTAATQTITLPSSPSPGWEVVISVGDFIDTVVGRNGQNIMGLAEDMTINVRNSTVNLVFIDSTRGWRFS